MYLKTHGYLDEPDELDNRSDNLLTSLVACLLTGIVLDYDRTSAVG